MPLLRPALQRPVSHRARFVQRVQGILGDTRLLWMPAPGDALTAVEASDARRVVTHSATPQGRLSPLGRGLALSFNGTSQYATIPDSDSLSFGTGAADSPFSAVVLANVTDTANNRAFVGKWTATGSQREWAFYVQTTDQLTTFIRDESAGVNTTRISDGAITQGAWALFGMTYSGAGGAAAADGITFYQNAAVLASTATNQAAYVAMENGTALGEIGRISGGAPFYADGSLALVAVCAKALTAADHAALAALCRQHFGVAL